MYLQVDHKPIKKKHFHPQGFLQTMIFKIYNTLAFQKCRAGENLLVEHKITAISKLYIKNAI